MSRDFTPQIIHYVSKEYPDLYLSNITFTNELTGERKKMWTDEEMSVRANYERIAILFTDRFIELYNSVPENIRDKYCTILNNFAKTIEEADDNNQVDSCKVPEEFKLWYLGKLDPSFYYHEENDQLFFNWCKEFIKEINLD